MSSPDVFILIAGVVTNLQQTSCEQDVFALLVPSLLTSCYKVVELNRLVTNCSNNLPQVCGPTGCNRLDANKFVTS